MSETKSAEGQIKEAVWTYGGWFVLLALTLSAGIALGYIFWGDALLLRVEAAELRQKIQNATGEKENALTQRTMAQEELARCQRRLEAATQAAAAAAPGSAGAH
ncbi:MAG: hypothetical protein HYY35_09435 [Deltaproteobacteria bacterium]|nr:hypothetical protein [Deltaproteobacteria bacterium]